MENEMELENVTPISDESSETKEIKSESRFTFLEATAVIVGHGVGTGILSVPYLASRNNVFDFIWIVAIAFFINVLLHLMIAELSYHNDGKQFVKCLENIFTNPKVKKVVSWVTFVLLGFSVLMNVCSYITGSSVAIASIYYTIRGMEIPEVFPLGVRIVSMLIYYALVAVVVYFGMKIVGITEKYCLFGMITVMVILFIAVLVNGTYELPNQFYSYKNIFALYGMISFALSSVMSVPQVVKGLNGNVKKIRGSIVLGTGINITLVIVLTIITLIGTGAITQNGALNDLSASVGGWVSLVGFVFTLIALSTSLWANTLNLRDVIAEQSKLGLKLSWLIASLPCLIIAIAATFFQSTFVMFARIASAVQIVTSLGIIIAFGVCRHRVKCSPILGVFGAVPFQVLVVLASIIASYGSLIKIV